jgi:hypothetical protein
MHELCAIDAADEHYSWIQISGIDAKGAKTWRRLVHGKSFTDGAM